MNKVFVALQVVAALCLVGTVVTLALTWRNLRYILRKDVFGQSRLVRLLRDLIRRD